MKIKTGIVISFLNFWIKLTNKLLLAFKKLLYKIAIQFTTGSKNCPHENPMSSPVTLCAFRVISCAPNVSPCTPCNPLSALEHIPCVPLSPPVTPCQPLYLPVYAPKIPVWDLTGVFIPSRSL